MNFFDVFIIFFENYLLALLSYVLMTRKESKTIFSILILGLVLSIETLISNYYYDYHLNIEISGTILLFSLYYSKDSFLYKIIISFIPFIILTMCNILAVAFFSILFQCEPRIIISENLYELISVILFMIITSMIFKMKVKGLFRDYKFFDNTWLPISLITFGMSVLFFILFEAISSGILNKRIVLIIFTLIIILISLCILLKVVIEEYKDKERVLLQLEKLKNDKEKYTSDLDFYQQLKILKHDMKYLYNYMNELIQHNEYKKLQEIIEKDINILYEEDDLKITNHAIFNMVLKEKLCWAKKQNIILKTDIRLPDTIAIDDLDLYILLSNLLDNAIENCDKGVAKIDMIAELKNEFLIITVCNPIIESVLKGNHKIKQQKKIRIITAMEYLV